MRINQIQGKNFYHEEDIKLFLWGKKKLFYKIYTYIWKDIYIHDFYKTYLTTTNNNKKKTQPTEWKEIFPTGTSDKELISTIYKELMQLNTNKRNTI